MYKELKSLLETLFFFCFYYAKVTWQAKDVPFIENKLLNLVEQFKKFQTEECSPINNRNNIHECPHPSLKT